MGKTSIYLDIIRLWACFLVLAYHFLPEYFPFGYLGVDIFFFLSGFLVAAIALRSGSISSFLWRRFVRIMIPVNVALALVLPIVWGLAVPYELKYGLETALANYLGLANVLLFFQGGYFSDLAINKPFLHLWSLSVELQFYVGFALVFLVRRRLRVHLILFDIAVVLISGAVLVLSDVYSERLSFFSPVGRFFEFYIGCIAFWLMEQRSTGGSHFKKYVGYVLASLLSIFLVALLIQTKTDIVRTSVLVSAFLFLLSIVFFKKPKMEFGSRKIKDSFMSGGFRFFARSTYPIYLVHWPIAIGFRRILEAGFFLTCLGMIISVILGLLVEKITKITELKVGLSLVGLSMLVLMSLKSLFTPIIFDPIAESRSLSALSKSLSDTPNPKVVVVGDSFGQDYINVAVGDQPRLQGVTKYIGFQNKCFFIGLPERDRGCKELAMLQNLDWGGVGSLIFAVKWPETGVPEVPDQIAKVLNAAKGAGVSVYVFGGKRFCDPRSEVCEYAAKNSFEKTTDKALKELFSKYTFVAWNDLLNGSQVDCYTSFDGVHLSACMRKSVNRAVVAKIYADIEHTN